MADVHVVSLIQATVALGQKLASLLQTLIELNPSSQGELKDIHYDIEATSGTLRQLEDLMSLDEAIRFERNTKPAVTSLYLDEIETLAGRCGLIYKSIILITQKAGVRGSSKEGNDEASSIENLKNELLTGPIPDPGSIKSIKLVRVPAKYEQQQWLKPRFGRCQEQLQWIRTGLLVHLHIFKLAQLQDGSVERNAGDFENELMYRSSIQLLRRRQVKSTKKKAKKQEKAQRQWMLRREDDSSETASVTSVASSGVSSATASTAVEDEASVKGKTTVFKDSAEPVDADKSGLTEATKPDPMSVADANQGETEQFNGAKGTTLQSFSLGGHFGANIPAYFFDWKQRIFGTDDKFKTDWPSSTLEAYICNHLDLREPRKVPFGHKRLQYGLNKVIKDGQKGKSNWNRYIELGHVARLIIDQTVEEANRDQSRERVLVAFQECNKDSPPTDSFILVFLSLRKEPKPIFFKDAVGRTFTLPFETCRKLENMKRTITAAFNHIPMIGPHAIEGHFDLLNSNGEIILPHLWNTTIKPGASITMRMWPSTTPIRGFYGPPPFIHNPQAPNAGGQALNLAIMRQMQQRRAAAMRAAQHPGFLGGAPPPPPPGGRPVFPPPRIVSYSKYDISEKEDEQLMFVDFVEELEKTSTVTVSDLLRKFTHLRDVTDDDSLCDILAMDSDYDSDGSTSTGSSSEIIND